MPDYQRVDVPGRPGNCEPDAGLNRVSGSQSVLASLLRKRKQQVKTQTSITCARGPCHPADL